MKVFVLASAEADLQELRTYIARNFSRATWQKTYTKLKVAIRSLATFPYAGSIPDELEALQPIQYRQIISGMNRVIYETRQDAVYIHAIVDTRRDMKSFLMRRLLR